MKGMKMGKRFLAMLLSFAMMLAFIPADVAKAEPVTYTVNFGTGPFMVDGNEVTVSVGGTSNPGTITDVTDSTEISLTGFNSETMEVLIKEDTDTNPFQTKLTVDADGKTNLGTAGTNFPNATLIFSVVAKENSGGGSSDIPVQFDNAVVEGDTITFTVQAASGDITVTAEVTGVEAGVASWDDDILKINRNNLGDVEFSFDDNYDNENMGVRISGAEGYRSTLNVNDSKILRLF